MDILMLIIAGALAGVLASLLADGIGYGIIGDIVVGTAGAFFGDWLFSVLGWSRPFPGLLGLVFVAFIGAVLLLLFLRLVRPRRPLI